MMRRYETASGNSLESRSDVFKRMKAGRKSHEKRQALIRKINKALKLAK